MRRKHRGTRARLHFERLEQRQLLAVRVIGLTSTENVDAAGIDLNASGWVAYRTTNGIRSEGSGTLQLITQRAAAAPGAGGAQFATFSNPIHITDSGNVLFQASLQGTGVNAFNETGVWFGNSNSMVMVQRAGDQAPGLAAGTTFVAIERYVQSGFPFPLVVNSHDQLAFSASVIGTAVGTHGNVGIWSGAPGQLSLVAFAGDAAPGTGGSVFTSPSLPVLNDDGHVAFKSVLGPNLTSENNVGVFVQTDAGLQLVAQAGNAAPGANTGGFFRNQFSDPVINDAGDVAFSTTISNTGNGESDRGVWALRNGSLQLVAKTGDIVPGTVADQFSQSISVPVISGTGKTSFWAQIQGTTTYKALFSEGGGSLAIIAKQGEQAPGLPNGYKYTGDFKQILMNASGRVAFMARVEPDPSGNLWGIFAQNKDRQVELIQLNGNPVEGSGVPGTVNNAFFGFQDQSGGQDGRRSTFNDQGLIAFRADLNNGTRAAFVSDQVAVPDTMQVASLTPTSSGFTAQFSADLDNTVLNLYRTTPSGGGISDVSLVGAVTGPVSVSLVVGSDLRSVTFIKTGGSLAPDTYTLTLRSAADGFKDASGNLLDGNGDGTAGDDLVSTFTVSNPAAGTVTVGLPDFTRGPGQAVVVPATGSGLPLSLSDAAGVTSATVQISYDPALLNMTWASVGSGLPAGATVNLDTTTPGVATVTFNSPTPLSAGAKTLVVLGAAVPSTAVNKSTQVLDLQAVAINGGAIAARADDALQVVDYFGDANGDQQYTGFDASRISRVVVGLDTGFQSFLNIDPVVIADINGDGNLTGFDASRVSRVVVGLDVPQIPALPSALNGLTALQWMAVESSKPATVADARGTLSATNTTAASLPAMAVAPQTSADLPAATATAADVPAENNASTLASRHRFAAIDAVFGAGPIGKRNHRWVGMIDALPSAT